MYIHTHNYDTYLSIPLTGYYHVSTLPLLPPGTFVPLTVCRRFPAYIHWSWIVHRRRHLRHLRVRCQYQVHTCTAIVFVIYVWCFPVLPGGRTCWVLTWFGGPGSICCL